MADIEETELSKSHAVRNEGVRGGLEQNVSVLTSLSRGAQKFSEYYANSNNIRKASVLAGFHPDYGHQLLKDVRVQAAIAYFQEVFSEKSLYTPEKLIRQWSTQASFDISSLLASDWSIKDLSQLPKDVRDHLAEALIGIEVIEKSGTRTIKPRFGKQLAQEHLGKLLKLYTEDKNEGNTFNLQVNIGQSEATLSETKAEDIGHIEIKIGEKSE